MKTPKLLTFLFKISILFFLIYGALIFRSEICLSKPFKTEKNTIVYLNCNQKQLDKIQERELIEASPDLLIIEEWNGNNIQIEKWKKAGYQINLDEPDAFTFGCLVLSKYVIKFKKITPKLSDNCPYPIFFGEFKVGNKKTLVSPIHFPPPVPFCDFSTNKYMKTLGANLKNLQTHFDQVILIGDFNSMRLLSSFKVFKSFGLKDFGSWVNYTWRPSTFLPGMLRIDYAWSDIHDAKLSRFKMKGLDHYGLYFEF
jgi:endonuclease/exonuclease/phosphatase (EEP) superfamily protein YafD